MTSNICTKWQKILLAEYKLAVDKLDPSKKKLRLTRERFITQVEAKTTEAEAKEAMNVLVKELAEEAKNVIPEQPEPKEKEAGVYNHKCFEQIGDFHSISVKYWVFDSESKQFKFEDSFLIYVPKKDTPYRNYGSKQEKTQTPNEIFASIRTQMDRFIELDAIDKDVLALAIMLTYHQEKLHMVPIIYIFGDPDSGKSAILEMISTLGYRTLMSTLSNAPNMFRFLGTYDDIVKSMCEDEEGNLLEDQDKLTAFKCGYTDKNIIPRIEDTPLGKKQVYYRIYCLKFMASENIQEGEKLKGLRTRMIPIHVVTGDPPEIWRERTEADDEILQEIRNTCLKWRMETRFDGLPEIDKKELNKRQREKWLGILQMAKLCDEKLYRRILEKAKLDRKRALAEKTSTLDGKIVQAIGIKLHELDGNSKERLPSVKIIYKDIWIEFQGLVNGVNDYRKDWIIHSPDFPCEKEGINKNRVSRRIQEMLGVESKTMRLANAKDTQKGYNFDREKLEKVIRSYFPEYPKGCVIEGAESKIGSYQVTEVTDLEEEQAVLAEESARKKAELLALSPKATQIEESENSSTPQNSQENSNYGNSVTPTESKSTPEKKPEDSTKAETVTLPHNPAEDFFGTALNDKKKPEAVK